MASSIRVLHVDDEPGFADMTATHLERENDRFDIETAPSASKALDRIKNRPPDCIVSDYDMSQQNGIELLEHVRDEYPDLPFILFTGKGSEVVASDAISAGVTDYLKKGPDTEVYELLANRITNAVEQRRAEQRLKEERQRFRTLFNRLSQPTVEVRFEADDPIIERINPAFENVFGYDADDLIGDSLDAHIVPDDRSDEAEAINQYFRAGGRLKTKEVTRETAEGPRRFLLQNAVHDDGSGGFVIYTDITERSEREDALDRNRELLRHTEKLADVGGWEADTESGEQRWTNGTYAIHDLDPNGTFDPTVEAGIEFYHPDDRPIIETAVENCSNRGEPYEHELRLISAEDEHKWVKANGEPVYDDDKIVKIRGAIRDITAQKERERDLRRYEQLVTHSPDLLVVLDENMSVKYQNSPSPLFEWEPKDVVGADPLDDIHPDDREKVLEHFNELLQTSDRILSTEFRAKDAGGEWQWIESRGQNLTDDDAIDGILAVMRRITDRKRQEQQLAQYSDTLKRLQRTTQALLEATDPEEAAIHAIEAFESVFDFEIAGVWLSTSERDALEPIAVTDASKPLISEQPTYSAETPSLSWEAYQEQELRYIRDVSDHEQRLNPDTPIRSEVIIPLGQYGLLNIGSTDVDAFREREIDLMELWAGTLTVAFGRITQIDLLQERESALRRERDRLDEFASVISHDLRNPLNVAMGRTELAAEETDSDHLTDVTEALSRMEAMIDDLLLLARQGETVGEREQVVVEDIASACWRNVGTHDATLSVDGQTTLAADRSRFAQVLENLFRNAIEHGSESVTVSVGILDEERGIYVADDGPGIPEEDREDVFDTGFTTSRNGNGFGLAIVKQICTAHGWNITAVESDSGGARIEITGIESIDS